MNERPRQQVSQPPASESQQRDLTPLDRDEYLARRKDYAQQYREAIGNYDKLVPWGAGGGLLVSITFLEKVAPNPVASSRWALLGAWAALVLALGTSLWSHYTSSRIYATRIKLLDNRQRAEKTPSREDWQRERTALEEQVERWNKRTSRLNIVAGWGLVVGALLLAVFAYRNTHFTG